MFGGIIFYVFAGVQIMMISSRSLSSKVLQNSFWRPWALLSLLGGSLCSLLFLAGLGCLFHRFGRCPNQNHFLEDFIFKSAPKLVLVTLAPFGPPGRDSLDDLLLIYSHFHCGSIVISAFWHPKFAFSLRIYSELCVLAPQIRVFTEDL